MSPESIQVVSQTIRVHHLDMVTPDKTSLTGEVEYTLRLRGRVGRLDFQVPPQTRITLVQVDGKKVDTAYDSAAAEQLSTRIKSFIYIDKRESQEWLPAQQVYAKLLSNRRDLLSLMEARNIYKSSQDPALSLFIPKSA